VDYIKTNKHIVNIFSLSGSHAHRDHSSFSVPNGSRIAISGQIVEERRSPSLHYSIVNSVLQ